MCDTINHQYRINLRAKKVFDTSASTKYCSDECARRSTWYETMCLASTPFESAAFQDTVQLLEDIEGFEPGPLSIPASLAVSAYNTNSTAIAQSDEDNRYSDRPSAHGDYVTQDEYSQLANNFLSRLAIVERQAVATPVPPSHELTYTSAEDSLPSMNAHLHNAGASLLPFDMAPLQRELLASQGRSPQSRLEGDNGEAGGFNVVRRVEIDVEPGYQEYMDQGWELFKQMRDAGDIS